jgi:hypothetical protein
MWLSGSTKVDILPDQTGPILSNLLNAISRNNFHLLKNSAKKTSLSEATRKGWCKYIDFSELVITFFYRRPELLEEILVLPLFVAGEELLDEELLFTDGAELLLVLREVLTFGADERDELLEELTL